MKATQSCRQLWCTFRLRIGEAHVAMSLVPTATEHALAAYCFFTFFAKQALPLPVVHLAWLLPTRRWPDLSITQPLLEFPQRKQPV